MKQFKQIIKSGLLLLIFLEVTKSTFAYNGIDMRLIFPKEKNTSVFLKDSSNIYSSNDSIKNNIIYKNSVFFEFGGVGVIYSLNFEIGLFSIKNYLFSTRIGVMYFPIYPYSIEYFPIMLNNQFKISKRISYEVGLGYEISSEGRNSSLLILNTGFKFGNKLFFKIDFTPIFEKGYNTKREYKWSFIPWGGVSIGFNFGRK